MNRESNHAPGDRTSLNCGLGAPTPLGPGTSEAATRPLLRRLASHLRAAFEGTHDDVVVFARLAVPLLARAMGRDVIPSAGDSGSKHWSAIECSLLSLVPNLHTAMVLGATHSSPHQVEALDLVARELPLGGTALSWLHQYYREARAAVAIRESVTSSVKLTGKKLLLSTQFFTPNYMVEFLVGGARRHLAKRQQCLSAGEIAFIDPACGGGNFLVKYLQQVSEGHTDPGARAAAIEEALSRGMFGYDLDPGLAVVAKLSVVLHATALLGRLPRSAPTILHGAVGDEKGFLPRVGAASDLRSLVGPDQKVILATNPPFLGRRLMSDDLRRWIRAEMPDAGADLCVAFMRRSLEFLLPGDVGAFVHQTSWMHLTTFRGFRNWLVDEFELIECAELGSGAFPDLAGEKTTVALSIIRRRSGTATKTRFIRLTDVGFREAATTLRAPDSSRIYSLPRHDVESMANDGFAYHVPKAMARTADSHPSYCDFGTPMQGTSTGDNKRFVRFAWEVDPEDPNWRRVSKGGGYCKWAGLHRYRVLWGQDAEYIRSGSGYALRNLGVMDSTQLVFSDTGNRGLNVRLLDRDQLFIASGPGILVREGDPLAHMAWLNSRLASFLLSTLTPKLTVSAGYIKQLPFPSDAAEDAELAALAARAVALKQQQLRRMLGEDSYRFAAEAAPLRQASWGDFVNQLEAELARLEVEAAVETRCETLFGVTSSMRHRLAEQVGVAAAALPSSPVTIDGRALDDAVVGLLDVATRYRGGRKRGRIGREGVLEDLAYQTGCHPANVMEAILEAGDTLHKTRQLLEDHQRHCWVLHLLGFRAQRPWSTATLSLGELAQRVAEATGEAQEAVHLWLRDTLPGLHHSTFFKRPLLQSTCDAVTLARIPR